MNVLSSCVQVMAKCIEYICIEKIGIQYLTVLYPKLYYSDLCYKEDEIYRPLPADISFTDLIFLTLFYSQTYRNSRQNTSHSIWSCSPVHETWVSLP